MRKSKKTDRLDKPLHDRPEVPLWAWLITWAVMIVGIVFEILGISAKTLFG